MKLYERLIRPGLFLFPAERAHALGKRVLSMEWPWRTLSNRFQVNDSRLRTVVAGLRLQSPIGLAAGFDKDADALPGLSHLGFGSITVGTIMPKARTGNSAPRMFRRPRDMAIVDHLGLPSKGLEPALRNLRLHDESRPPEGPAIIASVGGFTIDEVLVSHQAVEPWVDAVEVGLTCPNVGDKGAFNEMEGIVQAVQRLTAERRKPLFLVLPQPISKETWKRTVAMAGVAAEFGIEGVTAGGGVRVSESRLAGGRGGISGKPVFDNTLRIVRKLRSAMDDRLALKVAGGVTDGERAFRLLEAGASMVSFLTALVYLGPAAASRIQRGLVRKMEQTGVNSVRELQTRSARPQAEPKIAGNALIG